MADIVSNPQKINDIEVAQDAPITEALMNKIGGSINYALDRSGLTVVEFLTSGTWLCPNGVTRVLLDGSGGGAGGNGNFNASQLGTPGGGAGRSMRVVSVVPGTNYTVTIGAGGVGGPSSNMDGGPGGDTSLGTVAIFSGASVGVPGALDNPPNQFGTNTPRSPQGFPAGSNSGFSAGGGAGGWGPGGNGAPSIAGNGFSAAANTGGGGGGGPQLGGGGNGGSGRLYIIY